MPPFIALLLLALLAILPARASAQSDPVLASRAAYQEAVQAYEAHDFPGFLRPRPGGRAASAGARRGHLRARLRLRDDGRHGRAPSPRFSASPRSATRPTSMPTPTSTSLRSLPAFDSLRRAMRRNAAPLVRSDAGFTLAERDLLTEGIAYDPKTRSFFVGSVHQRKILRVDRSRTGHGIRAPPR